MVVSQDTLGSFIPNKKPKMVVMGTMVAICARTLDGVKPENPPFYYHNPRNHFWRVMQNLLEPKKEVKGLSVEEKIDFLNRNGVAITNLVQEIIVPNSEANDPSDTILFKAQKNRRIQFKKIPKEVKKILEETPVFFTCRRKTGIEKLLIGYKETNKLKLSLDDVYYLPTPTRCNPKARAEMWRDEIKEHFKVRKIKNSLKV